MRNPVALPLTEPTPWPLLKHVTAAATSSEPVPAAEGSPELVAEGYRYPQSQEVTYRCPER